MPKRFYTEILTDSCETTHAICDRLYDYQLQLSGALYLSRIGYSPSFIAKCNNKPSPDVKGRRQDDECVLECKFIHTSEKYESYRHRFHKVVHKYSRPKPRFLFGEQFRFPPSVKIKSLSSLDCAVIKTLIRRIYDDPQASHIVTIADIEFAYDPCLPPALVTIDNQREFAQGQGRALVDNYLKRFIDKPSFQLKRPEYAMYEKILFVGLQPDRIFMAPWTEDVISEIKAAFGTMSGAEGIELIFREDVGFGVRGYI